MLGIGSVTNFGTIQEEFDTQYLINGQYINKGIVKEVNELSKESIINQLKVERGKGYITLYHGTDINSYDKIISSGIFGDGQNIYFFTKNRAEAKDYSVMKAKYRGVSKGKVIKIKVPKYAITLNTGSYEYETKFMLKYDGSGLWIPVIN